MIWLACKDAFYASNQKRFTLAYKTIILLCRKLHISDLLSEFTALEVLLHQPWDKTPLTLVYASGLSFPLMSTRDYGGYACSIFQGWTHFCDQWELSGPEKRRVAIGFSTAGKLLIHHMKDRGPGIVSFKIYSISISVGNDKQTYNIDWLMKLQLVSSCCDACRW